ncbi:zinc finger-containing ubiquitin peptidase 1-like [Lytechinus variegatus]|uniref:zinc finger-containing ubiquitin peptidase 1-like n=1 Tax=Lytechinus variegatus TaxID=7654 RepID=UPI001BB164A2|nr:zinc finger-containing ubiquitin peptidase 1-like [Lytechinus variegatus]
MSSETCEICGQEGFVDEAEVRTHMLLDHEENSGSCPLCDLAHVTIEELSYHMNTAHRHVLSPAHVAKCSTSEYRHGSCVQDNGDDAVLIAEEVHEENSLIYIEDYFAKPTDTKQNGESVDQQMNDIHVDHIDDAEIALKTERDVNQDIDIREQESHLRQSMDEDGISQDLFSEASVSSSQDQSGHGDGPRESDAECCIIDESKESFKERKIVRLQAGRTGPGNGAPSEHTGRKNDQKQIDPKQNEQKQDEPKPNDRKRGRKEPDVRPKETRQSHRLESAERRNSHQSLDTLASSRSGNESVASETSSPFRKLFRTLTGRTAEAETEDKKEQSGIWVDLTNDSEPDLLDDDELMFIEDAQPAEEIQWEDIPSTSSVDNPHSTSTPTKAKSKPTEGVKVKTPNPDKPTLLSLSKASKNVQSPILCPICGLGSYDADFLNSHVNTEHPEGAIEVKSTENRPSEGGAVGGGDITCPVCGLVGLVTEEMNAHVESHFAEGPSTGAAGAGSSRRGQNDMTDVDRKLAEQLAEDERREQKRKEEEEFKKLKAMYGADGSGNFRRQSERNSSKAVWRGQMTPLEYHQQNQAIREAMATGIDSGQSRTKDIIPRLLDYYNNKVHGVSYARLSLNLDHFSSSMGDSGWGCGYRNIQMMLSALVEDPQFKQVVFNGRKDIPSIPRIQLLIEDAWSKGFDAQGRDQLNGKVHNTRKWIGATEVVAMFSALRIRCKLFDFHAPSGQNGTHPRLFSWIRDYFGKPPLLSMENSVRSNKLPLYFQHEGHSRTIIGYDMMKDKSTRILLFDPSLRVNEANSLRRGDITGHSLKPLRKTLNQMKAKQYQIVCIEGIITSDQEYERSKMLTSQRIL